MSRMGSRPAACLMNGSSIKTTQRRFLIAPGANVSFDTASKRGIETRGFPSTSSSHTSRECDHHHSTRHFHLGGSYSSSYRFNGREVQLDRRGIAANVAVAGSDPQTQLKVSKVKAENPSKYGFEEVKELFVEEYNSYAVLYRHTQTGAEIMSLCNDDENKTFGVVFRFDIRFD